MTKDEFAVITAYLVAGYNRPMAAEAMEVYFGILEDIPNAVMMQTAKAVLCTQKWFPSAYELRDAATKIMQGKVSDLSAAEAWKLAWDACGRMDPEQPGSVDRHCAKLPPIVVEAMQSFGINALCYGKEPIGVVRGQFTKIFEQLQARENRQTLLPPALQKSIAQNAVQVPSITNIGRMPG